MDIRKHFVQEREFEDHVQSEGWMYLSRWDVVYLNVYSGINNKSNYFASELNTCDRLLSC